MFLSALSQDEKVAFLELAHHLVSADGVMSIEELFEEMRHEMRLVKRVGGDPLNVNSLCEVFTRTQSQRIAVLELITLALVDGLAVTEHALINTVARSFNLSPRTLARYYSWAHRLARLNDEARALISEGDGAAAAS